LRLREGAGSEAFCLAPSDTTERSRAVFHRLLLSAFTLGIALVAAELLLPLVPPHLGTMQRIVHHVDQSGNYYLRPGVEVPFEGMFETISPPVVWQINRQGFRAASDAGPLSAQYRIATYGDSETFGWSVALDDTFQRRMEQLDADVEVLNFGIPGYNAENVADRIEATFGDYEPDLLVYLVNKNDVDLPNDISDSVLASDLLLRLRFLWQVVLTKPWRQHLRRSPERHAFLAGQLDRIARFAQTNAVPVLFVFMKSYTWEGAAGFLARGGSLAAARDSVQLLEGRPDRSADRVRVVIADASLKPFARLDDHLPKEAHEVLASGLCAQLSGVSSSCRQPAWTSSLRDRTLAAASGVVAAGRDPFRRADR
jgi:hypothetical protein